MMGGYEEALDEFRPSDNERARELSGEALAAAEEDGDQPGRVDGPVHAPSGGVGPECLTILAR